jgi:hypothetical protein
MSHELFWLVMTVAMTGLMWVPYILDRMMVRGMTGAMGNPSPTDKPQSPWAQRLMATPTTTFACQLYFWSRLVHAVVYTLGLPVVRTLAFVGGFVAQVMLVLALFKLA